MGLLATFASREVGEQSTAVFRTLAYSFAAILQTHKHIYDISYHMSHANNTHKNSNIQGRWCSPALFIHTGTFVHINTSKFIICSYPIFADVHTENTPVL